MTNHNRDLIYLLIEDQRLKETRDGDVSELSYGDELRAIARIVNKMLEPYKQRGVDWPADSYLDPARTRGDILS